MPSVPGPGINTKHKMRKNEADDLNKYHHLHAELNILTNKQKINTTLEKTFENRRAVSKEMLIKYLIIIKLLNCFKEIHIRQGYIKY